MHYTASKQWKWRSATIFTAVLVGVGSSIVVIASGCEPNIITLNDCPDAGVQDGGDAGQGGGAPENPYCP